MKRIKLIFAWYDLWVGLFWDKKKRLLYVLPLPMMGFVIDFTQYYAINSKNFGDIGVCTHQGAAHALQEDRGCTLRPISKDEFDNFE